MVHQEEKIRQILDFVQAHPESLASRSVIRRFMSSDVEIGHELTDGLEIAIKSEKINSKEIDLCYDLIK